MMKSLLSTLPLLICVLSAGAQTLRTTWPMLGGDPAHTSSAKININFPLEVSDVFPASLLTRESGLVVSEDKIFFSNTADTNTINAVDLVTGDSLWSFIVPNSIGGIAFTPAVGHGVVLAGGQQASELYGLDVNTGNILWSSPTQGLFGRSPTIYDSLIYVAANEGLICIDLLTGETKWSDGVPTPQICPAVDSLNVYYNAGGVIYARNRLTGDERWSNAAVTSDHGASYMLDDNFLYFGLNDTLSAFNKTTGEVMWQTGLDTNEIIFYSSMGVMSDSFIILKTIIPGLGLNHYRVIEKASGNIINTYTGGLFSWGAPSIINDQLVDCVYNTIRFMNKITGDSLYALSGLGFGLYPTQVVGLKDKIIIAGQGQKIIVLQGMPSAVVDFVPDFDVAIFPNPSSEQISVSLSLAESTTMHFKLISISGFVLRSESLGFLSQGEYIIPVSLDGLSPGIYFAQLQGEGGVVTKKLFVE